MKHLSKLTARVACGVAQYSLCRLPVRYVVPTNLQVSLRRNFVFLVAPFCAPGMLPARYGFERCL